MTFDRDTFRARLAGISGILATPFDGNDRLDTARLRPVVERAVAAGVHILTANGNTGEFYALTTDEAERAVHAAAELVAGRVPLIAGIGRSIGDALALTRASRAAGASALMVHQPPDPFVAPRGVVEYVRRVAEAGQGLPVVIYLRNDGIGLDAIGDLCAIPEVVGVKWATPAPMRLAAAMKRADPALVWVGGLAETWAPAFYAVGARGFTSGLINVWPAHSLAIHAALEDGDYAKARALIEVMEPFEALRAEEGNGTNVSVVKAALALMGEDCGAVRPPGVWPLAERQQAELHRNLVTWGLLKEHAA
ncbi:MULTISPECIES: dihydrodipicolinate synthase family protein [Acidiphilium]|uniref:Putative dihydrodipicolinate synthase n=1 Tax=Acidiphilium multivorum (strain DSM 11245 / JCM 8867 / NBRC 100883 / AIU 301) TaxID=926570 RepID=F0J1Y2_ACIMA|nr:MULTISPECIES: dihydrodipicolinate synthase family protein [Acidiphilium]MBS3024549.1 dihydrodipicolinate synthase family protein [Acidiphilium multivorum]BAJ79568.1 putative dihydrodipicolinate synthase [Acidiphilium multivorum AIU301]GAN73818.1 dihydrodipicolinate synthetase [Acidiphilium multivorum AIU301]